MSRRTARAAHAERVMALGARGFFGDGPRNSSKGRLGTGRVKDSRATFSSGFCLCIDLGQTRASLVACPAAAGRKSGIKRMIEVNR
jgi:hypothetical protein